MTRNPRPMTKVPEIPTKTRTTETGFEALPCGSRRGRQAFDQRGEDFSVASLIILT